MAVRASSGRLGVNPSDLLTAMSYETNGRLDPNLWGGKDNKYLGLNQFGPQEQASMASSPACSLVTGGTSTAYTVTTNQNNSGGAHGICGAGTVPNNGQMIAVTPNNTNGRSENWRGSASPVSLSSVYLSWDLPHLSGSLLF
jgi:hypothetical protein